MTVAEEAGCSPAANTQAPALCISSLTASTWGPIRCISGVVKSTTYSSSCHTESRYWAISESSLDRMLVSGFGLAGLAGERRDDDECGDDVGGDQDNLGGRIVGEGNRRH